MTVPSPPRSPPLHPSIHPLRHGLSALSCPISYHFLTMSVSRLLGLALVSCRAFSRVGVHRLSLRPPYLGVFPITLLHLPLNLIRVSPLPSVTHFLGEFPGFGLAVVAYPML